MHTTCKVAAWFTRGGGPYTNPHVPPLLPTRSLRRQSRVTVSNGAHGGADQAGAEADLSVGGDRLDCGVTAHPSPNAIESHAWQHCHAAYCAPSLPSLTCTYALFRNLVGLAASRSATCVVKSIVAGWLGRVRSSCLKSGWNMSRALFSGCAVCAHLQERLAVGPGGAVHDHGPLAQVVQADDGVTRFQVRPHRSCGISGHSTLQTLAN